MGLGFWASFLVLCSVQASVVFAPGAPLRRTRVPFVGVLLPAGLLVLGVVVVQEVGAGARALTDLATIGTPAAAALAGFLLRWKRPWLCPPLAAALYVVAWQLGGLVGQAAGVLLIAGACLSAAGLAGRFLAARELTLGLVLLVCLDVILVFGTSQVTQTTTTLHATPAPVSGQPLPALQDVTFGSATMGWLDLLAPALLGVVLGRFTRRARAAVAVLLSALAWGCLLYATPVIPATVPVLAGLLASRFRHRGRRRIGSSSLTGREPVASVAK